MNVPVAQGAVAQAQSVGPVRDYNLAGLAIEELESYPMGGGVQISGI
jgi:methylglyoxal synthase